jgi:hypothetical protein
LGEGFGIPREVTRAKLEEQGGGGGGGRREGGGFKARGFTAKAVNKLVDERTRVDTYKD